MAKVYEIDFSVAGMKKMQRLLSNINTLITDKKLLEYIGNKCKKELEKICVQNLTTLDEKTIDSSDYMKHNNLKIEKDTIILYNNSKIDISSKNMKETTKANYPAQLSLAKIVEYGIGYTGNLRTDKTEVEDWEYDVHKPEPHGYKGWYYIDDNGQTVWTNGFEGRLIYFKLKKKIKQNIYKWIKEYVELKLK